MAQTSRPRVLITGVINRPDLLAMFEDCRGHLEMVFVEYAFNYGVAINPEHYRPYGDVHAWSDYRDVEHLLDATRPDAVVLLYNSSIHQLTLKLAAQRRGLRTCHLEHGLRQSFSASRAYVGYQGALRRASSLLRMDGLVRRALQEGPAIARQQLMALRSTLSLPEPARGRVLRYATSAAWRGLSIDDAAPMQDLRRTDEYLAFSPNTFEFHQAHDGVVPGENAQVRYIGIPYFDRFARQPAAAIDPRNVLLVDNQLHNASFFGWTLEHRRAHCAELYALVEELDLRLLVKTHPGDVSRAWEPYVASGRVTLLDLEGLERVLPSTSLVLGCYTTMQLPLAALPHTALLTLEMHPQEGVFLSREIVDLGAARAVRTFAELRDALLDRERVLAAQRPNKDAFIARYLFKMDGLSGRRLREALLAATGFPGK